MDYNKIPTFFENENDSRKKAKDTLTKIFENKMLNIDTIKSITSEFHKYENQNNIEVFNRIERNINESEVSTKKIGDVIKHTEEVILQTQDFFSNWTKITAPLNFYGKDLENLMLSKKNVSIMRHNLNIYVKIKDQIKELRDLINANDNNVVIVYKQIRYLTYLRSALLEKINKTVVSRSEKLNILADHLLCVQQFEEEFFNKFWKYFELTINWAVEKPEFLVKLLRLIEEDPDYMRNIQNQFQIYNKTDEKFSTIKTGINSNRESNLKSSVTMKLTEETLPESDMAEVLIFKITEYIDSKFYRAFVEKVELSEILNEIINLTNDLYTVQTKVVPCFPPKYDIFNVYKEKYLQNIYSKIQPYMNEHYLNENKGNLILFAKWLDGFSESLEKVGIDIYSTQIGADVGYYMSIFYDHVNTILEENITSILQKNLEDKETLAKTKNPDIDKIQSFYASDIFRSLYNVIELLSGDIKGQLLYEICRVVLDKLKEVHNNNDRFLINLKSSGDMICSCVYTLDANNCKEIFPDFKKKIKKVLPQKEFYSKLKVLFTKSITYFNDTIKIGCTKSIELMFIDLETNFISKIFTTEWNEDILNGTFETFRSYFNRGFSKIFKQESILLILVRSFLEFFSNIYIEELIHSIRSLNRKQIGDGELSRYKLKYLKLCADNIKYSKKEERSQSTFIVNDSKNTNVKVLDKFINNGQKKEDETKYKKYEFPVKKFSKESKELSPAMIFKKIHEDFDIFSKFLDSFKENAKEPFSKYFPQTLGQNYINTYLNKFNSIMDILKCSKESLKDTIPIIFKEAFSGEDGKALLEALLYIREDFKVVTKPDNRKFYLRRYDS